MIRYGPCIKGQVTECIILFSAPIETRTKYVDCPVTTMADVRFVYLGGRKFSSVFSESSSPTLSFDLNVTKRLLPPPLEFKDIGPLSRGPCMLRLSPFEVKRLPLSLLRILSPPSRECYVLPGVSLFTNSFEGPGCNKRVCNRSHMSHCIPMSSFPSLVHGKSGYSS